MLTHGGSIVDTFIWPLGGLNEKGLLVTFGRFKWRELHTAAIYLGTTGRYQHQVIITDTGMSKVGVSKWFASIALESLNIQTGVVVSDGVIAIRRELLPHCLFCGAGCPSHGP